MDEGLRPTPLFYLDDNGKERIKIYYYTKEREVKEVDRKVELGHRRYYKKEYAEFVASGRKFSA